MDFELRAQPTIDIVQGIPEIVFYFTDAGPLEDEICNFIEALDDPSPHDVENTLRVVSPISQILDTDIGNKRFVDEDELILPIGEQAYFSAIRADLLKLVEKIDSIAYKDDSQD